MSFSEAFSELESYSDPGKAEHSKRFFKSGPGEYGEGDKFLGITVPNQRKVARKFRKMNLDEVRKLLQNEYHEARLTAVMLLVYKIEKSDEHVFEDVVRFYLKNLGYVNNWDIVDSSCHQILGRFLFNKEKDLLYELAQSENLWEKRVSMITCYHFIKRDDFEDALKIAELLLYDDHDLIHKAVGWMLREIGNRNLDAETEFLDQHFRKMPRTMLRYAIEKFDEPLRKHYLHG